MTTKTEEIVATVYRDSRVAKGWLVAVKHGRRITILSGHPEPWTEAEAEAEAKQQRES